MKYLDFYVIRDRFFNSQLLEMEINRVLKYSEEFSIPFLIAGYTFIGRKQLQSLCQEYVTLFWKVLLSGSYS